MNEFAEMEISMDELIEHRIALDYSPVAALLNALETQLNGFKHEMTKGRVSALSTGDFISSFHNFNARS